MNSLSGQINKILIIISILVSSICNSYGQWYVSKYNVTDINYLSEFQLDESLKQSKSNLLASGGIAVFGGGFFILSKYTHQSLDEDATFFEQLLGENGKKKLGMFTGAALFVGGTISGIVQIGRIGSIKSAKARNFPLRTQFHIAPSIFFEKNDLKYYPGLTISCHF